jgi:hypothetical protein
MSCYANVDDEGLVLQVIVADAAFIATQPGTWLPTPEPGELGYPGLGYQWHADLASFVPPIPYPSWTLNADSLQWEPPTPMPDNPSVLYSWDEGLQVWVPR